MIRSIKTLGLSLVAVLALGAMTATGASAAEFHAEEAGVIVSGSKTNNHVFNTGGGTVTCSTATFSGTATNATDDELTINPHYTGCTAFSIANTHVKMNGCDYLFTVEASSSSGPVHVQCPGSAQIEVTPTVFGFSACTVKIPGQTPTGGGVTYTNLNSESEVEVDANVTGIHYTSSGGLCGSSGTNATYTGKAKVAGSVGGEAKDIWVT